MADTAIHRERFAAASDAVAQGAFLERDFLSDGWREVFRQEPPSR